MLFLVSNGARTSVWWLSEYQVMNNSIWNWIKDFFVFVRFVTEEKVLEIEVEVGVADGYQIPFLAEGLFV